LAPSNFLELIDDGEEAAAVPPARATRRHGSEMPQSSSSNSSSSSATLGRNARLTADQSKAGDRSRSATLDPHAFNTENFRLYDWFFADIDRGAAERLVLESPPGSFLIRTSQSNQNDFTLTARGDERVINLKIRRQGLIYLLGEFSQCVGVVFGLLQFVYFFFFFPIGSFSVGLYREFANMAALVDYLQHNEIRVAGRDALRLTNPLKKRE
jgi:hypothetical protein